MVHRANKPIPKLRKASQPPRSHPGAIPDTDRAKRPPLSEPAATGQELTFGDRVEGLGNFGRPTGEFGTVERTNEEDAVVKWDDDGRMRLHQRSLKKVLGGSDHGRLQHTIVGHWRCEMSNSDLIRKHFSAYEHKGHGHGLHYRGKQDKRTRDLL